MKKEQFIVIVMLALVVAVTAFIVVNQSSRLFPQSEQGLGSLCSNEAECQEFCLNNRGKCEQYCKGNKNQLCTLLFPPTPTAQNASQTVPQTTPQPTPSEPVEDCSNFSFTHYIIDPSHILRAGQIGWIGGGNTEILGTSYISLKDGQLNQKTPVYAPRDMTLFAASFYMLPNAPEGNVPDYGLVFDLGCQHTLSLAHVKEVTPVIKERMPPLNRQSSAGQQVTPLPIKAGDLIGYIHKTSSAASIDFIVENAQVTNKFINQARYEARFVGSNSVHRICPYDLYQGAMKESYYALLPKRDCGTMERDKAGTIAGQWFLNPDPAAGVRVRKEGYYGSPLPIILEDEMIHMGNIGGEKDVSATGDMRIYKENPTFKDPAQVTTEHCYQNYPNPSTPEGYLYLKLINDTTMHASYSPTGTCPSSFPAEGAKVYYR